MRSNGPVEHFGQASKFQLSPLAASARSGWITEQHASSVSFLAEMVRRHHYYATSAATGSDSTSSLPAGISNRKRLPFANVGR